jgi:IS1 family transposase/transposase-like protein
MSLGKDMNCPKCGSNLVIKYGYINSNKQRFMCKSCRRQFVENPENKVISLEIRKIIDNLLLERVSQRGISRVTGVSLKWLQSYVKKKSESVKLEVWLVPKPGKILVECDEMWTFVQNKSNRQWIWLAIDIFSRMIVGFWIGQRDQGAAKALFLSLPSVYRQCAGCYTDKLSSYVGAFPQTRHKIVKKGSGKTNHIERVNLTFRQRVSPLVRKTLSFAKNLRNLRGVVLNFINHYNQQITLHV